MGLSVGFCLTEVKCFWSLSDLRRYGKMNAVSDGKHVVGELHPGVPPIKRDAQQARRASNASIPCLTSRQCSNVGFQLQPAAFPPQLPSKNCSKREGLGKKVLGSLTFTHNLAPSSLNASSIAGRRFEVGGHNSRPRANTIPTAFRKSKSIQVFGSKIFQTGVMIQVQSLNSHSSIGLFVGSVNW